MINVISSNFTFNRLKYVGGDEQSLWIIVDRYDEGKRK